MSWYAIDNLNDALDATTGFLTPIDWRTWVKLAVVVFFAGGPGGGFNIGQANLPTGGGPELRGPAPDLPPVGDLAALVEPWMVGIAVLGGLLILLLNIVGAVMEFVLLDALREEHVSIRRSWRTYWRSGLRLFGFRLALFAIIIGLVGIAVASVVVPILGIGSVVDPLVGFVVLVPVAILGILVLTLVLGFTTQFVVPIMMLEDRGVLDAWRRFWPTLRREWKQYTVYVLLSIVLGFAGGILTVIVGFVAVIGLLIPFGILGALAYALFTVSQLAGIALGAIVVVLFVIALVLALTLVRVPVVAYLRYYALLVLGDTNEALDLIPDIRGRLRNPPVPDE